MLLKAGKLAEVKSRSVKDVRDEWAAMPAAEQIRTGGEMSFVGDKAYLGVVTNIKTENPDGSMTFTSTSTALSFELEDGVWRVAD